MPTYYPLLIMGAIIGVVTTVFIIAYATMKDKKTAIGFDRNEPGMISMIRSGTVSTALIFEEDQRHYSVFDTPLSTFQLCTYTELVENKLLSEGKIRLEYIIEIRGAQAERCHMDISVRDDINPFKNLGQ